MEGEPLIARLGDMDKDIGGHPHFSATREWVAPIADSTKPPFPFCPSYWDNSLCPLGPTW